VCLLDVGTGIRTLLSLALTIDGRLAGCRGQSTPAAAGNRLRLAIEHRPTAARDASCTSADRALLNSLREDAAWT
jgi:hypothetical protein